MALHRPCEIHTDSKKLACGLLQKNDGSLTEAGALNVK